MRPARSRPPRRARNSECLARSGGLRLASGGSAPGAAWALAMRQEGIGALGPRGHPLGLPGSPSLRACGVGDTPGTCPALCSSGEPGALVPASSCLLSAPPPPPPPPCLCCPRACLWGQLPLRLIAGSQLLPVSDSGPRLSCLGFQAASALSARNLDSPRTGRGSSRQGRAVPGSAGGTDPSVTGCPPKAGGRGLAQIGLRTNRRPQEAGC